MDTIPIHYAAAGQDGWERISIVKGQINGSNECVAFHPFTRTTTATWNLRGNAYRGRGVRRLYTFLSFRSGEK